MEGAGAGAGGSRKIVEVFIETDSESDSSESSSHEETAEPTLTTVEEPPDPSPTNHPTVTQSSPDVDDGENQSALSPIDNPQLVSTFYHGDEDESMSQEEPDINFQEPLNNIFEDSIATTYTPSEPIPVTADVQPPPEDKIITDEPPFAVVEKSKVIDKSNSPPLEPKPIDPNREYCFCRQPPDTHSMIYCHQCLEWFHGECVGLTRQKAACIKRFYCPLCIDKNPSLVSVFESRAEGTRQHGVGQVKGQEKKSKNKKHCRRCGECVGCLTEMDCRKCRFCRDMTKYGGRGSLRQKCIKRQCLRYSRILHAEDPIYTTKVAPVIQEELEAGLRAVGGNTSSPRHEDQLVDVERPDIDFRMITEPTEEEYLPPPAKKKVSIVKKGKTPGKGGVSKGGTKGKPGGKGRTVKPKKKTRLSTSDFDFDELQPLSGRRSRQPFSDIVGGGYYRDEPPQQCYGPECVFPARPHSKYCSEECGIQLAMRRIRKHLPQQRKLSDEAESQATHRNKANLERLEEQQKAIKKRLEELDGQTIAIDNHVQRLSSITPVSEDEADADSDDLTIHCATCSQPVTLKKAMPHFERCFNRLEGMVSFGSIVKNEGTNIFCDKFDSSQKTYCKRLRVLCPEHTKEPKIGPNEVCGCPLEAQFPSQLQRSRMFCRLPRKSCGTHYCWEKLRKAEIDQVKLNLYLKLEELNEGSRLNQWQINCRSSLLAVMLHHTVDHDKATLVDHTHNTITEPSTLTS